jgi:hypothetical protein
MIHYTMNGGFISIKPTKLTSCLFECSILDYHHYCSLKALDEDFVYLCFWDLRKGSKTFKLGTGENEKQSNVIIWNSWFESKDLFYLVRPFQFKQEKSINLKSNLNTVFWILKYQLYVIDNKGQSRCVSHCHVHQDIHFFSFAEQTCNLVKLQ